MDISSTQHFENKNNSPQDPYAMTNSSGEVVNSIPLVQKDLGVWFKNDQRLLAVVQNEKHPVQQVVNGELIVGDGGQKSTMSLLDYGNQMFPIKGAEEMEQSAKIFGLGRVVDKFVRDCLPPNQPIPGPPGRGGGGGGGNNNDGDDDQGGAAAIPHPTCS